MKSVFAFLIVSLFIPIHLFGVNLITNGNFETNMQGWFPFNNNGSHTFAVDATTPIMGNNSAKITITNGTSNGAISENWRLGTRWRMSTFKSGRYLVHFKAKASRNLQLVSMFQQNFSPYSSWGYVEWNLTTTAQDFDVVLENTNGGVGGYWAFVLYYGHLTTGDQVWIDDVKIEELVGSTSGELTDGNICNGDFETSVQNLDGEISGWKTYLADSDVKMRFEIDSIEAISGKKSIKITNLLPEYSLSATQKIFGFDGQNRYAYCPSVIKESGISHVWFCGNPIAGQFVDYIYYMQVYDNGTKTNPVAVLLPGSTGKWDDRHVCDPTIIKGNFMYNNQSYKYAMFYLGNNRNFYYNEIGVAFSNTINSTNWIKFPNAIIPKTWSTFGDFQFNSGAKAWGVGQPSAISLDNNGLILLAYTIGDINGTRVEYVKVDLSDMSSYVQQTSQKMVDWGLKQIDNVQKDYTCNVELALDTVNNMMIMIRPVQPNPIDYPNYINETLEINYMGLSDFENSTGTWKRLLRISPSETNYPRNHNACIERNSYGKIINWQTPTIYYTVSSKIPDVQPIAGKEAEWSYEIWKGTVLNN